MPVILAVILLLALFCCGLWDVWAVATGQGAGTVSEILHTWSLSFPILPMVVGIIIGHIFWPNTGANVNLPK